MKKRPFFQLLAITTVSLSAFTGPSKAQNEIGGPVAHELQSFQADKIGVPKSRPEIKSPAKEVPKRPVSITPKKQRDSNVKGQVKKAKSPSACITQLQKIAETRLAEAPSSDDKQCMIDDPVELVTTKGPFPITFANGLILNCKFAVALADFTKNTLQPLARHHLETTVKQLGSGQGFVCRRRNNAKTGKLSEHAFGNAIDLTAFVLKGKPPLNVRTEQQMKPNEARFQRALRKAACGTFTTVLGPGSNEAHATHLHFDLGRSGKKNPYRICE